jgi:hypothetical protein
MCTENTSNLVGPQLDIVEKITDAVNNIIAESKLGSSMPVEKLTIDFGTNKYEIVFIEEK